MVNVNGFSSFKSKKFRNCKENWVMGQTSVQKKNSRLDRQRLTAFMFLKYRQLESVKNKDFSSTYSKSVSLLQMCAFDYRCDIMHHLSNYWRISVRVFQWPTNACASHYCPIGFVRKG